MARWEEALDAKLDLYTFTQSERGQTYIEGWLEAEKVTGHLPVQESGREMTERIARVAFLADPVWVDPDLQTLWEAAVPTFEPEPLHEQDLLTRGGFVYLPRPHFTKDIHGRASSFRAFAWGTTLLDWRSTDEANKWEANFPGALLFVFHQIGDVDDYDTGTSMRAFPTEDHPTAMDLPYGRGGLRRGDLILDFVYPWPFGAKIGADGARRLPLRQVPGIDNYVYDEEGDSGVTGEPEVFGRRLGELGADNMERHVQCLWRLMQQTITTKAEFDPTRPVRRRYERAKVDSRKITVITLRKPSGTPSGNHRDVEWSHRWLVAGHWRMQPYPSIGTTRQIWISPYIKGPEDKPLDVRKERVFELVR